MVSGKIAKMLKKNKKTIKEMRISQANQQGKRRLWIVIIGIIIMLLMIGLLTDWVSKWIAGADWKMRMKEECNLVKDGRIIESCNDTECEYLCEVNNDTELLWREENEENKEKL